LRYREPVTFRLERPLGRPAPLVVEIPHAGTEVPEDIADSLLVDPRDVRRDADLYVDELFRSAPAHGAVYLAARISRYVVDLNRFEHDVDATVVPALPSARMQMPRGLIWRETTDGRPVLKRPLTPAELEARLDRYYRPYHAALASEIQALRARHGYVVVLSAHSMPSVARPAPGEPAQRRADVVPGSRGRTTAAARVIDTVETHFRAAGLSVRHDDPYRGGATTVRWGQPYDGIHAVQLELNRALYMDEAACLPRRDAFRWLTSLCDALVERLAELPLT
jgi:N-formylglutamate amidohydrolase